MSWDPYAALGLAKGADAAAIKKAYRKLAKENHPDVRPNDPAAEEKFKRVTAAFNLLSDPKLKARYDRGEIDAEGQEQMHRHAGAGAGSPFGRSGEFRPGFDGNSGQAGMDGFEDLFSNFFTGGGQKRRKQTRGEDKRYAVDVDFMDAITGAKRRLAMTDGKMLDVAIPAGITSGQKLRLKSQGHPGIKGAPPGDAILELKVRDHAVFTRNGNDVHRPLPISLVEAVEGARIDIETPLGSKTLTIPQGASSGAKLRMRGLGVQVKNAPGDLYVELRIVLPEHINSELKNFLRTWSQRNETPQR